MLDCVVNSTNTYAVAAAANIGVGGDILSLLSDDNPDGVIMITEEGKITFANKVRSHTNTGHHAQPLVLLTKVHLEPEEVLCSII